MPASDQARHTVVRCLTKAGWSIIKEQFAVVVADNNDNFRRLSISELRLRAEIPASYPFSCN